LFYYDRSDVQQQAADPTGAIQVVRLTNIGDVEVSGAELELTWAVNENFFFQMGLGYADSEIVRSDFFSSSLPRSAANPVEGTNSPNYSKFTGNVVARYERSISTGLIGLAQLEYAYRSDVDLGLITNEIEDALMTQLGYGLINLRLGISSEDMRWSLQGYVENLSDEVYRTQLTQNGLLGAYEQFAGPRIWGVSLTYNW